MLGNADSAMNGRSEKHRWAIHHEQVQLTNLTC